MRWLQTKKDDRSGREPVPHVAIESVETSRPEGREGRLFDLVILSLFLHSAGSSSEMMSAFLEKAPSVTESMFVYPLVLDKKRDVLTASPLEGIVEPLLERAMDALQEDLTVMELDLPVNHFRRLVIEGGEVVIRDSLVEFWDGVIAPEVVRAAEEKLGIKRVALVPMLVEGEPYGVVTFGFDHNKIDASIVELLVGHFTLAMRDIATLEDTARFNDIDPVTWVHNRRFLGEAIEQELIRCGRYAKTLSAHRDRPGRLRAVQRVVRAVDGRPPAAKRGREPGGGGIAAGTGGAAGQRRVRGALARDEPGRGGVGDDAAAREPVAGLRVRRRRLARAAQGIRRDRLLPGGRNIGQGPPRQRRKGPGQREGGARRAGARQRATRREPACARERRAPSRARRYDLISNRLSRS